MSQLEELQRRIVAAMDRIGAGVEAMQPAPEGDSSAEEALRLELAEERAEKAQLQQNLVTLNGRLRSESQSHEQEVAMLRADLEELRMASGDEGQFDEAENQALQEQLAEANAKLASVEAARAELADAKAALENQDELDSLKEQNAELRAALSEASALEDENARLRSELADTERVAELNAELDMLRAERSSHGAAMSRLDDDLQRMRKANQQLRVSIDELRTAAEIGIPDSELLNRATVAELEATRAAQATDAAEAQAVLARLEPLLTNAKLTEGEVE